MNKHYKFPVMTRQEIELFFNPLENIDQKDTATMEVTYADVPQENFEGDWQDLAVSRPKKPKGRADAIILTLSAGMAVRLETRCPVMRNHSIKIQPICREARGSAATPADENNLEKHRKGCGIRLLRLWTESFFNAATMDWGSWVVSAENRSAAVSFLRESICMNRPIKKSSGEYNMAKKINPAYTDFCGI